jgi:hypothetical protein
MNCQNIKALLPAYLDGSLTPEEIEKIESHLTTCADCRREYLGMKSLYASLEDLPKADPAMRERFMGSLHAFQKGLEEGEKMRSFQPGNLFRGWIPGFRFFLIQAAMLLVVFFAGLNTGTRIPGQPTDEGRLNQLEKQLTDLQQVAVFSLLKQPLASDRLLGIEQLTRLNLPEQAALPALYERLYLDDNINVRLAALDALAAYTKDPLVRENLIRYLDKPNSPLLRIEMMKSLVRYGDQRSLPVLEEISRNTDEDSSLQEMARWSVQYLKGKEYHDI